jgi:tripartite-type tricarboxylate transporter receptor subunit TctC
MAEFNFTRRALLAAMATTPLARRAGAQSKEPQTPWPDRPVRVTVPYPPGGGADTTARIIYANLSEQFGQQFAIENRGGAGGTIGEAVVAKSAPDGYMLLHDATAFSVNGSLYRDLPFDYRKDFDPVALVGEVANIFVVTPSVPVTTVADVIAYAKASPGGIDMASSGNGTLQHLLLELFGRTAGIKVNHVPYRGGGLAMNDVMAGQVKFYFANGSAAVGLIKGGRLKAIAHTGKGRLVGFPDLPAMSDTLPGFEGYDWNGVFLPHGTPVPILAKLSAGINKTLVAPSVRDRFAELNIESHPNTPDEFRAYLESQMQLWSRVVKEANIKLG